MPVPTHFFSFSFPLNITTGVAPWHGEEGRWKEEKDRQLNQFSSEFPHTLARWMSRDARHEWVRIADWAHLDVNRVLTEGGPERVVR